MAVMGVRVHPITFRWLSLSQDTYFPYRSIYRTNPYSVLLFSSLPGLCAGGHLCGGVVRGGGGAGVGSGVSVARSEAVVQLRRDVAAKLIKLARDISKYSFVSLMFHAPFSLRSYIIIMLVTCISQTPHY